MHSNVTRFRVDPLMPMATAAVLAGFIAGALTGIAGTLWSAPAPLAAPYDAPEVCELPPPSDPIGFLILQDQARPAAYL